MNHFQLTKLIEEEKYMEKITYKEQLLATFNAQVLPESNLIRDDKNLFTFSPIQDELTNFKLETKGVYYKEQTCFRQVYPANLINPLSTPCQPLISIFSFQKIDFTEIINTFISTFLNKFIKKTISMLSFLTFLLSDNSFLQ